MKTPERRILVVDDSEEMAKMICDDLAERGFVGVAVGSGQRALALLAGKSAETFAALITDLRMPDVDGLALLEASRAAAPDRPVIVMTAYSAIDTAVESIRRGAYHYLTKPFKTDELVIFLERALAEQSLRKEAASLRTALAERLSSALIGDSQAMRRVRELVTRVADSASSVLILGETGTGKGVIARAIHAGSVRAAAPFVTVNCAALPEALLESELFGHVKGAFTGATSSRPGLFVEAHAGTLFLDEIGDMALPLQAKLLGAIERGVVRPLGAEKETAIDTRLIAATNKDLAHAVRNGAFREDLLYRLDVVTLTAPPLRSRAEDIPALLEHFLAAARARHEKSVVRALSPAVVDKLCRHSWPGNVRELEHVVERIVILGRDVEAGLDDLPPLEGRAKLDDASPAFFGEVIALRELQRRYARWALLALGGHKGKTAERLDIDGKTLQKLLSSDDE